MRVIYLNVTWCWIVSLAVAFAVPHLPLAIAPDLHRADLLEVARDGRLGGREAEGTKALRQLFLAR